MATYNGGAYLREQLDSILNQTHHNFELIVVDDGSNDETLAILNEYSRIDERVHVFPSVENLGVVKNFERGLRLTNGDFIVLSDQDDIFRRDKFEVLLNTLRNNPNCDMVVSDLSLIDDNGKEFEKSFWKYQHLKPVVGKPFRRLMYSNFVTGCAAMFTRRLLNVALPFPNDCKVHDWWLAVVAASSRGGGICLIGEPLVFYRQHDNNVIGAKKAIKLSVLNWSYINYFLFDKNILEKRKRCFCYQAERLSSYLESDAWTSSEKRIIERSRELFLSYANESQENMIERFSKLLPRLQYGFCVGGVRSALGVVFRTLFPLL
ncbi:glycosyltransferase family 2 protein [Methylomonas sp. SURF-2]|uniref:Glycosyltransferase family 2 protein n=1 Tax=Methylomonas subterranea TaxID=2952225 RepID=A0ABT1TCB1_9GAMM|nr:glycosyltransferase family 2 protein [Methylomonas sp. SURF-2]MCQ8103086.1 glycosyltransferase family 2 protein [Methylomonas sp. SURF-2]